MAGIKRPSRYSAPAARGTLEGMHEYTMTRADIQPDTNARTKLKPPGPPEDGWELHSWQVQSPNYILVLWQRPRAS